MFQVLIFSWINRHGIILLKQALLFWCDRMTPDSLQKIIIALEVSTFLQDMLHLFKKILTLLNETLIKYKVSNIFLSMFILLITYIVHKVWASLEPQLVKNHLQYRRPGFNPWVGKITWRRERLSIPVFWPGEFHDCIVHRVTKTWTLYKVNFYFIQSKLAFSLSSWEFTSKFLTFPHDMPISVHGAPFRQFY